MPWPAPAGRIAARLVPLLAALTLVAACGDDGGSASSGTTAVAEPVIDPGDGGDYAPEIDPADFSPVIDNPWLPYAPGSRWVYEVDGEDGTETITVEVTDTQREVMGVTTTVVRDVVEMDGEVIEDTFDYFAQDTEGNVWYFGEDTTAFEDGEASQEGSWEAGVDGALPGIVMPADPDPAAGGYRQEYLAGEAEDMGEVIRLDGTAETPAGTFEDLVVTVDWTPLEPDVVEEKYYAEGIGFVQEVKTEGPAEAGVLVEYRLAG